MENGMSYDLTDLDFLEFCAKRESLRKKRELYKDLSDEYGTDFDFSSELVLINAMYGNSAKVFLYHDKWYDDSELKIFVDYLEDASTWYPKMWKQYSKSKKISDARKAKKAEKIQKENAILRQMENEYGPKI